MSSNEQGHCFIFPANAWVSVRPGLQPSYAPPPECTSHRVGVCLLYCSSGGPDDVTPFTENVAALQQAANVSTHSKAIHLQACKPIGGEN